MGTRWDQGFFKPDFPEKYAGSVDNIFFRSSWEKRAMRWFDLNPNVVRWNSEEFIIPYMCGTDGKQHRYYVDFVIQVKNTEGSIKTYMVEVKPDKQTREPKYHGRKTKNYLAESMTWVKNQSKWAAAREYCIDRGWEFIILTEYELGIKARGK